MFNYTTLKKIRWTAVIMDTKIPSIGCLDQMSPLTWSIIHQKSIKEAGTDSFSCYFFNFKTHVKHSSRSHRTVFFRLICLGNIMQITLVRLENGSPRGFGKLTGNWARYEMMRRVDQSTTMIVSFRLLTLRLKCETKVQVHHGWLKSMMRWNSQMLSVRFITAS